MQNANQIQIIAVGIHCRHWSHNLHWWENLTSTVCRFLSIVLYIQINQYTFVSYSTTVSLEKKVDLFPTLHLLGHHRLLRGKTITKIYTEPECYSIKTKMPIGCQFFNVFLLEQVHVCLRLTKKKIPTCFEFCFKKFVRNIQEIQLHISCSIKPASTNVSENEGCYIP